MGGGDDDLGRLLDRAAGALSHTHPGLAAELTARADREHQPPDPFDGVTGDRDVDRFRCFGYLVLPGFLDADTVEELRTEIDETLRAVHGDGYDRDDRGDHGDRPAMSGMAGYYACLLGPWAPRTVDLVDSRRLVGLAERLVGGPVLPSPCETQGILYVDHAPWHCDSGIAVRGVKLVAYLEPRAADDGALRVLPGSHRLPSTALRHLHSPDVDVPDVPGQALATEPGDVIAFDPFLYHASWGGKDRRQWTTTYLREPATPSQEAALLEWYDDGLTDRDGLPEGYRPFDRSWVAEGSGDVADRRLDQRHRWMYRLDRLGVLDRFGVRDAYRP
jgi:hypothetical protein